MPNGNLATLSLDALAERLAPRIAPQISVAAGISGALAERSDTLSATLGIYACLWIRLIIGETRETGA
jgi:hypothetical protein